MRTNALPPRTIPIIAFFISGFAGLVYEVCWIRKASLVFGSTTYATSTVLAVFFAGLALGSYLFGRVAQRTARPLRLFVLLETGVCILALASPFAFDLTDLAFGVVYRTSGEQAALLMIARIALVAVVLLPPTVLMGGTLPLFCREYVDDPKRIAGSVGGLYGINTLGAAAGAAAAGFLLLPHLGLLGTIALGAGLSALSAVLVATYLRPLGKPSGHGSGGQVETTALPDSAAPQHPILTLLFFLAGFVAIGTQVVWTRYLTMLIRNTVYTYTITLTVVLIGIVLGSTLIAPLFDRWRSRAFAFGLLQILSGILVLTTLLLPPPVWEGFGENVAVYALLMLPGAVLSGASFPLAVRMLVAEPSSAPSGVGRLYAVNTLGGIAGALLVGFVGLPQLGLQTSILLTTGLGVATGITAWLLLDHAWVGWGRGFAATAAAAAWFAVPQLLPTRVPADFLVTGDRLVDYHEGLTANLAVVQTDDALQMKIGDWWQGQDRKNHQAIAAHVPMLLHPDPAKVLVVGTGVGQTASRFLMYDIESLEVVDIEPGIFTVIAEHFDAEWMRDPRTRLIPEDGLNHISHTGSEYDVVSIEVGQVSRPGVAFFYTRDFYRRARARLRPGGVLSQFMPLPFFDEQQFRGALRSFLEVFPQSVLWYNTAELLLIGVNADELRIDGGRLALLQTPGPVSDDLSYRHWGAGPESQLRERSVFLGGYLTGPEGLAALAGDAAIFTDDRPVLDYTSSKVSPSATNDIPLARLLHKHLQSVAPLLDGSLSKKELDNVRRVQSRNLDDIVAEALLRRAGEMIPDSPVEKLEPILAEALKENPGNFSAHRMLAQVRLKQQRFNDAARHFAIAVKIRDDDAIAHLGLGAVLLQLQRPREAVHHLKASIELRADHAEARNNLGVALAQQSKFDEALAHFQAAIRLRPDYTDAKKNLKRLEELLAQIKSQ